MKIYTSPLLIVVSILAFIGGCAPTSTLQNKPQSADEYLSTTPVLPIPQVSTSVEIDQIPDSDKLLLAEELAAADKTEESHALILSINSDNLDNRDFVRHSLLIANIYIANNQLEFASQVLQTTRFNALTGRQKSELRIEIIQLQADVAIALGNYPLGLEKLIKLSRFVKRKSDIRAIHDQIWTILYQVPYKVLSEKNKKNYQYRGWLKLAASSREYQLHPNEQAKIYSAWRRNWKSHPAAKNPPSYFGGSSFWNSNPDSIGLLVSLQENYLTPSKTLIDGFMDAYYSAMNLETKKSKKLPEIRIYDSSSGEITAVYNQAVKDGMDLIIGPMRQSEVEALGKLDDLPVPTISLNRLDSSSAASTDNLYQFGLSTEDELTQIANRAWQRGHRNILMISPDNSWGRKSADFMRQHWVTKGGSMMEDARYPISVNDFTKFLKQPLQIDLSEKRGLSIKRFINSRVKYSARRRQDIDVVVMLGYPIKARQIKPALDFLYASDIPVMATSHIFSGLEQTGLDRDLSQVEFTSMPWTLKGQLAKELQPDKQLHTAYRHLYALGHDSFLIARNLSNLEKSEPFPLFGATGLLLLKDGTIVREQKWAKFKRGAAIESY
ncbi:penicillin-binding protein activator [Porticoccaceae bacterium]|nr:penicillin-binding protein activator [Porticoccaceae bacterium]